LKTEDLTAVWK